MGGCVRLRIEPRSEALQCTAVTQVERIVLHVADGVAAVSQLEFEGIGSGRGPELIVPGASTVGIAFIPHAAEARAAHEHPFVELATEKLVVAVGSDERVAAGSADGQLRTNEVVSRAAVDDSGAGEVVVRAVRVELRLRSVPRDP